MSKERTKLTKSQLKAIEKTKKLLYEVYGLLIHTSKQKEYAPIPSLTSIVNRHHLSPPTLQVMKKLGVISKHPKLKKFYMWTLKDAAGKPSDIDIPSAAEAVASAVSDIQREKAEGRVREPRVYKKKTSKKAKKAKRKYTPRKKKEYFLDNEVSSYLDNQIHPITHKLFEDLVSAALTERLESGSSVSKSAKIPLGGVITCTFE